jgi:predicted DNA-binding protein
MAVSVRMDPLMEKELELAAKRKGVTKSQFIIDAVERALGRKDPLALLHQVKEEFAPYRVERAHRNTPVESDDMSTPNSRDPLRAKLRAQYAAQQEDYAAYLAAKAAGQEPPTP